MVELTVKEIKKVESGNYVGEITKVTEDNRSGYDYIDIEIKEMDGAFTLSTSVPANLSQGSRLGALLEKAGHTLVVDQKVDIDSVILGRQVKFNVKQKEIRTGSISIIPNDEIEFL